MSQIQSYVKDVSIQIIWHAYSNTIGITFLGGGVGAQHVSLPNPTFVIKYGHRSYREETILIMRCDLFVNGCLLNLFVQAQIKENIKVPRHWLLWGESTGARWIPLTNRHHAKAWIWLCAITNWTWCLDEKYTTLARVLQYWMGFLWIHLEYWHNAVFCHI